MHRAHRLEVDEILEPNTSAGEGAGMPVKGSLTCIDWKSKEMKRETFQRDSTRLPKEGNIFT
jgi:hypothetical protein